MSYVIDPNGRFTANGASKTDSTKQIIWGQHLALEICPPCYNAQEEFGEKNLLLIEEFLQNNDANLSTLEIRHYNLRLNQIERIANALRNNRTIRQLIFKNCNIGNKEALLLANALINNIALEKLDFSNETFSRASNQPSYGNRIDYITTRALVNAVIEKPNFKTLNLTRSCHQSPEDVVEEIQILQEIMRMQRAGKRLQR